MRYVCLAVLTLLLSACSSYNFVPTPVPEEIHTVVYTNSTAQENLILRITNDDLKVHLTKQSRNKAPSNSYGKATSNNYNIMATEFTNADFTKVVSLPYKGNQTSREKLVISTNAKIYTFTQDGNTRFPSGIAEVVTSLPSLFPVR